MELSDSIQSFDDLRTAFVNAIHSGSAHVVLLEKGPMTLYQCIYCHGMIQDKGYRVGIGTRTDKIQDQCYLHDSCHDRLLLVETSLST